MPQMRGRCARANMRMEDPDLATLEKMPSAMPNCWRPVFLIFSKKIRMVNQFAKLLEMLLDSSREVVYDCGISFANCPHLIPE